MTNPHEQVYIDYLNYDWEAFSEFQQGLKEICDNYLENLKEQDPSITAIPALDKQQLVDQAKSFFYCKETGNILNLDDFLQWKLHNGAKYDKNQKIQEITEHSQASQTQAQTETPQSVPTIEPTSSDDSQPPYSSNYQELVELIMSGKPVPGTKDIPDTVLTDSGSVTAAKPRLKPWEKNVEARQKMNEDNK